MKYIKIIFLFFILCYESVSAQRIIRRDSRFFIEAQNLPERVDPLLCDRWDQYAPYNNLCPIDSVTGERSVVGCVATAMAQVMNYWQWPLIYDWKNILYEYSEGSYSQIQADAVARLCYDCGIAVNMRYNSASSGARSIYQAQALATKFDYDKGVQMYYRDFYSLDEITLMLKKELAAGRPVLISGYNVNMGHAFVVDGYDENDWFHTCWGNPGHEDDAWTYLPNMVPDQPQWYSPDSPENGFNLMQMFTTGIMPSGNDDAKGIETHLFVFRDICAFSSADGRKKSFNRNNVNVVVRDLSNIGWNLHDDSVSLMLVRDDRIVCPLYTYSREFLLEEIEDTTYTDTLRLSVPESVSDGTYRIVPMYRDNNPDTGKKEWVEARTSTGTPNYIIAVVNNSQVLLTDDTKSTAYLTLESVNIPDFIVNGDYTDYEIKLRNHQHEMVGRIYLLMESLDGGKNFYIHRQGITVGADQEYVIHNYINKTYASQLGKFRLHILYESNLFTDKLILLNPDREIIINVVSPQTFQLAME